MLEDYTQYQNKDLLNLVSQNDEAAFTELYNRYWKKLFTIAYSRLNEVQSAEDIVHDVFIGLWTNRHKVDIDLLENYLATATKYAVLNKIRKKVKERNFQTMAQPEVQYDLTVETSLHYKRILEIIKTEVDKLPEKCRLIFKYSREEGMPVKKIATQLNLSPKTVENQLGKALRHLRLATRQFLHSFFF